MIMCTPKFDNNVQLKEWKKLSGYYCFLQGKNDTVAIGSFENEFSRLQRCSAVTEISVNNKIMCQKGW